MADTDGARPIKGFRAKLNSAEKTGELYLYDSIGGYWGGITAEAFVRELEGLGKVKELNLYVNSDGGEVFAGTSIYNALVRHPAKVNCYIDGLAASVASLICMAASSITIGPNAWMMIHEPWWGGAGTSLELRKMAEMLDKMRDSLVETYCRKSGMEFGKCSDMVAAETWLDAQMALQLGLVDSIGPISVAGNSARFDVSRFRNAPKAYTAARNPTPRSVSLRAKHGRLFQVFQDVPEAGSSQ